MKIQHLMALVVLSLPTVPGARAAVLAGPITNAANAHTYYLLSANTWTASEAEARGLGGHLVTINDAAENQWVRSTFFPLTGVPYASLWIGLNDAANEGQFVWANGEPVTFGERQRQLLRNSQALQAFFSPLPIATFGFELLEGSHLQVHVNWG